jgi:lysophospholipase L1-like esterase
VPSIQVPALKGTPNDVVVMNAVGPGTYTLQANRSIPADATVKSRINTGSPFTDGQNAQLVAVVKAKLNSTNYVSITGAGDSITQGACDAGYIGDSYRAIVNTSLLSTYNGTYGASLPLEWEGPTQSPQATSPTQYSGGVGGATTLSLWTNHASLFGTSVRLPDVIVVIAGTNDAAGNIDATSFSARYQNLITAYHNDVPSAKIVVGYVPENPLNSTANTLVTAYNGHLPTDWTALETNLGITLYKTTSTYGLTSSDMCPVTSIHPNVATGYPKIAAQLTAPITAAVAATGKI